MKSALLCLLLCAAFPAAAQAPPERLPLFFKASTPENIGQRMAYAVREKLRRASNITLITDTKAAWMYARFDTGYPIEDVPGIAYSLTLTINDSGAWSGESYWQGTFGFCGKDVTDKCAASLMASIDQAVSDFQAEMARRAANQKQQPAPPNTSAKKQ